jgi:hypothetical protein
LVIAHLDARVPETREYYYRENRAFGYIQFQHPEAATKAVEILTNAEIGGAILGAEKCLRLTAKEDNTVVTNSILVIKNLPYNMKEEKLLNILHAFDERPEDVSFHHDSNGTFRGMAFVKYSSVADAVFVYDHINSIDVGGRPLKVEYKRKPDPNDEEHQKLQQQLLHFKDNDAMTDLAFPFSLSNSQRKQIHSIAEKLGLRYQSFGENENRYIIVSKKKDDVETTKSTQIPKRKQPFNTGGSWNDKSQQPSRFGSSWSDKSAASYGASPEREVYRTRSCSKGSKSPGWTCNFSPKDAKESIIVYVPKREPKGPDGTNGFGVEYRRARTALQAK